MADARPVLVVEEDRRTVQTAMTAGQRLARRELVLTAADGRSVWVLMSAERSSSKGRRQCWSGWTT